MKKRVHLKIDFLFETNDHAIAWIGSSSGWEDEKGNDLSCLDFPSEHNLLIHILGKEIEGLNGNDKLAIVDGIK